jgi:hypothetical protein
MPTFFGACTCPLVGVAFESVALRRFTAAEMGLLLKHGFSTLQVMHIYDEVKRWLIGLFVAVVVGSVVVSLFLYFVRGLIGIGDKPKPQIKRVPPWLTGFVERFVFAVLIGLDVPGSATAMMGWLALSLQPTGIGKIWKLRL